jgi:flagellar assembly factor FliW
MLKIETTRFGSIKIEEDKIIAMPFGMLGFQEDMRFVILQHKEDSPFFWYQSIDDPTLAFVITSPLLFKPDYEIDISHMIKEMSWDREEEDSYELYVVVNIPKGSPEKMTANLIGPILINTKTRQAVQMVIADSIYSHRFPIIGGTSG